MLRQNPNNRPTARFRLARDAGVDDRPVPDEFTASRPFGIAAKDEAILEFGVGEPSRADGVQSAQYERSQVAGVALDTQRRGTARARRDGRARRRRCMMSQTCHRFKKRELAVPG